MQVRKILYAILILKIPSAYAFNGVYLTGSGAVSAATGGVSLASGFDRMSISDNPANLSWQSDGADLQLSLLNVKSKAIVSNQPDEFKSSVYIPIPGLAIAKKYDDKLSYGVSVIGAGASVNYKEAAIHDYPADDAKDNLAMSVISPALSYKVLPNLSLGLAINLGAQQFRAKGVLVGEDVSGNPLFLPSHGNQWAYGYGATIGTTWNAQPDWSVGASYTTETKFSKLDEYKDDLLASSSGHINLPEKYGIGTKYSFNDRLKIGLDYLRINWSAAKGFGKDGAFQWKDQHVYRIGTEFQLDSVSSLRFGYSYATDFLNTDYTNVNFYANAISHESVTFGYGRQFKNFNLNLAYEYAFNNTQNGTSFSTGTNLANNNHVVTLGLSKNF
ncbi:OmpP1/FadL family transporter [Acinetobacter haemolyticus]|uniref:OmpP1/FadL family transporter n=1 Tax=Acinetobacter haemolyticus TaxID=29430 RepID=UPI001331F503|nr:outer membrane protein transport protein [Acinetobacter haemolyticus]QHI21439.1 fatty acid and hydrocarbon transporter (SalD) [Acinetobacter haemolyticus]